MMPDIVPSYEPCQVNAEAPHRHHHERRADRYEQQSHQAEIGQCEVVLWRVDVLLLLPMGVSRRLQISLRSAGSAGGDN